MWTWTWTRKGLHLTWNERRLLFTSPEGNTGLTPPPCATPRILRHLPNTQLHNPQIDLDTDQLHAPADFVGLSPMVTLRSHLSSLLNPGVDSLDDPSSASTPLGLVDGGPPPWGGGRGGRVTERGLGFGLGSGGMFAITTQPTLTEEVMALFQGFVAELLQGAAECSFEIGQGNSLSVLLDERLYRKAKSAAAEATWVVGRVGAMGGVGGGEQGLYNRDCEPLLNRFVKTQMLSQYLSAGVGVST
ncbi:unnamed protein product [Discosporangium mesarthrocarpum]